MMTKAMKVMAIMMTIGMGEDNNVPDCLTDYLRVTEPTSYVKHTNNFVELLHTLFIPWFVLTSLL